MSFEVLAKSELALPTRFAEKGRSGSAKGNQVR